MNDIETKELDTASDLDLDGGSPAAQADDPPFDDEAFAQRIAADRQAPYDDGMSAFRQAMANQQAASAEDELGYLAQADPAEFARRVREQAVAEARQEMTNRYGGTMSAFAAQAAAETVGKGLSGAARGYLAEMLSAVPPDLISQGLRNPSWIRQARMIARGWEAENPQKAAIWAEGVGGNTVGAPLSSADQEVVTAFRKAFKGVDPMKFLGEMQGGG